MKKVLDVGLPLCIIGISNHPNHSHRAKMKGTILMKTNLFRSIWYGVSVCFTLGSCIQAQATKQPPCSDVVTAAGWITGTPSGAKANFGAAGGIKDGAFWGHLHFVDHGSGMYVKSTAVTGYAVDPNDATCRIIDYTVLIGWAAGNARIRVCDKGEPGANDIFQIQLSNGYFAGGDLGGTQSGGGNVQIHKPNGDPFASDGDNISGFGSITGTPSGTNADFRVTGGNKRGELKGQLSFLDKGNGVSVESTAITGYVRDPNDADCRIIDYDVTIGGQAGTARVRVCDKGNSGLNDIFEIQLSNGYFAGGNLVTGNLVLHKKAPPTSTPPPDECDFVTCGGWITGTPSGSKADFGAAGGLKNGVLWGRLDYIDHGNGMHVKDTAVT